MGADCYRRSWPPPEVRTAVLVVEPQDVAQLVGEGDLEVRLGPNHIHGGVPCRAPTDVLVREGHHDVEAVRVAGTLNFVQELVEFTSTFVGR